MLLDSFRFLHFFIWHLLANFIIFFLTWFLGQKEGITRFGLFLTFLVAFLGIFGFQNSPRDLGLVGKFLGFLIIILSFLILPS